jgi:Tim17/Tim22/Tim23/Pmp24 family
MGLSSISYDSAMTASADPYADNSSSSYSSVPSYTPSSLPPIKAKPAEASGGIGGLLTRFGIGGKKEDDKAAPVDTAAAAEARRSFNAPSLNVGLAAQASSIGLPRQKPLQTTEREERYLRYERRGLFGQMSYNVGYSYIGGLALGGAIGFFQGLKNSPNRHPRILVNSILNGSGKNGSRLGNAAGVLAMLYTVLERQAEDMEFDRLPAWFNNGIGYDVFSKSRSDMLIPATAAFATGAFFTLPRASEFVNNTIFASYQSA